MEHEVGAGLSQVEGLDVGGAGGEGRRLVGRRRDGERRAGLELDQAAAAVRRVPRLCPVLAVPVVVGLADPIAGTAGANPQHDLVPQRCSVGDVESLGEAEKATHACAAPRCRRPRRQRCAAVGELAGARHLLPIAGRGEEERGRRLGRGKDGDQEDGEHGDDDAGTGDRRPRSPARRRHRLPHGDEAGEGAGHPGQHPDAELEVDGLRRGHRHEGGRSGQRIGHVAPGGHVEGVGAEHPGEQSGEWALDGADVAGGRRLGHRGDEPDEAGHGADGEDGLGGRPGVLAPPVGEDVADHGGHDGEAGDRGGELALVVAGAGGHDDGGDRRPPEGDRVLGRSRAVGLDDPLPEAHAGRRPRRSSVRPSPPGGRVPAPAWAPAWARASRRPSSSWSRTGADTRPVSSSVRSTTRDPGPARRTRSP